MMKNTIFLLLFVFMIVFITIVFFFLGSGIFMINICNLEFSVVKDYLI